MYQCLWELNYFEDLYDSFLKVKDKPPVFAGTDSFRQKAEKAFAEFLQNDNENFTDFIEKFPMCSLCKCDIKNNKMTKFLDKQ